MRTFAIHRRDGSIVGIATTQHDDGPRLVGSGRAGETVTEVELPEPIATEGEDAEQRALEALTAYRVNSRIVKKS